jgi:hypothetical protein
MRLVFKGGPANEKAFLQIANLSQSSYKGIRRAFYNIGKDLLTTSRDMILDAPKSGQVYIVKKGTRNFKHQASAPGEAPANLTGNLRKSIGFDVRGGEQLEFGSRSTAPAAGVSPNQNVAAYARALELGNPKHNLAKRPYLKPSIVSNQRNATEHFESAIKGEFDK